MYKPVFIILIIVLIIFLKSCSPVNYSSSDDVKIVMKETNIKNENPIIKRKKQNIINIDEKDKKIIKKEKKTLYLDRDISLSNEISIILPNNKKNKITKQFINVIEFATYQKKLHNINFTIDLYENEKDLRKIIDKKAIEGRIFIGPLESKDAATLENYCNKNVLFFSFASKKSLAKNCIFLINFFPKNELKTLFDYLPVESKIALLFPENTYGYKINLLIDEVANSSDSIIINRASYNEDLTNVRQAIKELGKYELRKYELIRQKQILRNKKDQKSKRRLKQLERFQTTKDLDFTHIILPDYGLRLLQVAPLLLYYDVDPEVVQFVGTGVWDDPVFFSEPSLQKAIFPGVQANRREGLVTEYNKVYNSKFMRTSTLVYDLIGLLYYVYEKKMTLDELHNLLNNSSIKYDGIDGGFYFRNNIIERDLDILQISKGKALKLID